MSVPPRTFLAHNGARVFGGAELWTVRLLERFQARGHRVAFLCRDEAMAERARERGVPARVARLGGHPMIPHALRFAALLRSMRPDGLLLSTFKKTWLGGMGARLAGVPRVVARIGLASDRPGRRAVYRVAFRRWIDTVVVNADGLRAGVLADLPELDPARVVTIHNGVELPPRRHPEGWVRRELDLPTGTPVVGAVARLAGQKRLDRFLEAVARLPGEVHGVLAGDGPLEGELRARAGSLGVGDRVHFLGRRDDVADVLAALDVFLLTSDQEGMSNAMLEAMAAGVPVVSTPVSGAGEALEAFEDGVRPGRIVSPGPDALAREVRALLADPALRAEMGRAGERRTRERFRWEDKVDRWEAVLAGERNRGQRVG